MILLRTLGALTVLDGADRPVAVPPKPLALLAYLATARPRGPHRRDTLLALFYPEADASRGRTALRRLLLDVREATGAGVLQALDREQLQLNRAVIACDVWRFEDALAERDVTRAVDVYQGPFLAGFHLSGCPGFEDWLSAERARLHRSCTGALEHLAGAATDAGDIDAAARWWRQLVECEPHASRATLGLMKTLATAGDLAGALQAARVHACRLRDDLDAAPAAEVEALADQLRNRVPRASGAVPGAPVSSGAKSTGQTVAAALEHDARVLSAPADRPAHVWTAPRVAGVIGVAALGIGILWAIPHGDSRLTAERPEPVMTAEQDRLASRPLDPIAREAYLRGRYLWNRRTEGDLRTALAYFHQATEADSTFALAHVALAETYTLLALYGTLPVDDARDRAVAAANAALRLDDHLGEAFLALAQAKWRLAWDTSAGGEFRRGLALSPNLATGHQSYGGYLMATGRRGDAIEELARAVALDPVSLIIGADLGAEGYFYAREYGQAAAQLRKVIELDRNFAYARVNLCKSLVQLGDLEQAIAECRTAVALSGRSPGTLGALGHAYAVAGRRADAQAIIREMEAQAGNGYRNGYEIALIHTALGSRDEALAWLERGVATHARAMEWIRVDPRLDPLRSDQRFRAVVQRMHLPS